jgi:hypothetical protein
LANEGMAEAAARLNGSFAFENAFKITLSVQNSNDADSVIVEQVINPNSLKSGDRP